MNRCLSKMYVWKKSTTNYKCCLNQQAHCTVSSYLLSICGYECKCFCIYVITFLNQRMSKIVTIDRRGLIIRWILRGWRATATVIWFSVISSILNSILVRWSRFLYENDKHIMNNKITTTQYRPFLAQIRKGYICPL